MKGVKSKKPRKQRKYRSEAALHKRRKMIASTLKPDLRKKYNRRSVPVRKGDVIILKETVMDSVGTFQRR